MNMQEMLDIYTKSLATAEELYDVVAKSAISPNGLIKISNDNRLHMYGGDDPQAQINNCRTPRQLKELILVWITNWIDGARQARELIAGQIAK